MTAETAILIEDLVLEYAHCLDMADWAHEKGNHHKTAFWLDRAKQCSDKLARYGAVIKAGMVTWPQNE